MKPKEGKLQAEGAGEEEENGLLQAHRLSLPLMNLQVQFHARDECPGCGGGCLTGFWKTAECVEMLSVGDYIMGMLSRLHKNFEPMFIK